MNSNPSGAGYTADPGSGHHFPNSLILERSAQRRKGAALDDPHMVCFFAQDRRRLTDAKFLQKTQNDHIPLIGGELMLYPMQDLFKQDLVFQTWDRGILILSKPVCYFEGNSASRITSFINDAV